MKVRCVLAALTFSCAILQAQSGIYLGFDRSDGKIRTCLFSVWDHDLHAQMRRGSSDEELADFIRGVIQKKEERHHIGEPDFVPASRTMVHIGG